MEMYGREDIDHNAIAVHISRLRPKLATISILIDMKKTFGYMLQEAA
jgi:DNA-binding response OmpR family regulator